MKFPVDLLASVDPGALELSAKDYMSKLLYQSPEIQESLRLPDCKQIDIGLCNVSFVPLYGHDTEHKILALYSPDDIHTAVGLYLMGQWWSAEDILKTADPSRTGLLEVRTSGERIVLYVLNRIIYRTKEIASDDVPFLCHEKHEIAKILWKDGEAIGFYSFKPEGTLCNSFVTQCYQLPVMDTVFIRKCHRGHGYGVQMLEDFVSTFRNSCVGLKYPLPTAMYKVCKNYLSTYPADKELLWEVQGVGGPYQRTLIFKKLQTMELKGDHQVVGKLNLETDNTDLSVEKVFTPAQMRMEHTVVEVTEEEVQIKITKEVQDTPVTSLGRSSSLKRKKLEEDTGATTEKIMRVEDIEAGVPSPVHEPMPEAVRSSQNVNTDLKDTTITVTHSEATVLDISHVHCQEQKELTTESEQYMLEVCALTKPSADTVTPEEALDKTELLQMTPVTEIQSIKSNEETQIVKYVEATIGATELQQLVEVEIVKMTSGTKVIKEKTDKIEGTKDGKDEGEDEISEKRSTVDEEAKLICEITSDPKLSQQTELDLKPVTMDSEDSSATEVRILTRSSRVSTAAHQQKSTHIHQASKPCPSKAKSTTERKSLQRSKAVQQNEGGHAADQPANEENLEMRHQVWMEEKVVEIVTDANEACLTLSENIEETYVMNEDVLKEKDKVQSPEDAVLQGENVGISAEKMIVEDISQEGTEIQKDSEIEKREENDITEELLQPNQAIPEEPEESKNDSGAENEAGVLGLSVIEKEQTEQVQEEEPMNDTSIVHIQVLSHDAADAIKSDWTEPTEEEDSDKAGSSGKHAGSRRSNYSTPLRRSGRFKDQSVESELTGRILRSGTKSVTAISKQGHVRHTKTVKQQEKSVQAEDESEKQGGMETVGITNVERNRNLQDSVEGENRMEKEYLETESTAEKNLKDGSQNETTGDVTKIAMVDVDDAEIVNEGETQVEGKTAVQTDVESTEEQEKEPATEMAQKDDKQNVVVPPEETGENVVSEETLQSQEDKDQELVQLTSTEKDREESKEDEEVKQTEPLVKPAKKEQEGGNETSAEMLQSEEEDELIKASVAEAEDKLADIGAEEPMMKNLKKQVAEVGAENMLRTDNDQEVSMSVEEELRDDKVVDIRLEEESVAAELHTSARERNQEEVQESVTPNSDVTVQESSPEEETPVITSRSLRQRTVTVKCPPQRKSKRFQKAVMETTEDENVVMVEVMDKTDKSRVEETEENKNEKMETEDGAVLKDEGRVSESADTDQGLMEVMQEKEHLKQTQGREETEIEDISEPSHGHVGEESDNWTEPVEEEDSDKAGSSEKHASSRRSNCSTPLRRSGRFKDQSEESELTGRVLRSSAKPVTAISKQSHVRHTKTVKQQEKSAQAGDEPEVEQMEEVTESHTGAVEGEKNETVDISCEGENENVIDLQDSAVEHSNVEKEDVEPETTHDNDLKEVENKMEDGSQNETTCESKKITVMDVAEVVKDIEPEAEGKTTESLAEPVKKGGNETTKPQEEDELHKASVAETGVKEPMTESLKEQAMEPGSDNLMKDGEQGEIMPTEEKDDGVGETSLNKESTTLVYTSESEKNKDDQEIIKPDHGKTVQENVPEEETPVITSRSLRRRTVTVKSPPQRKSKCLQKTEVENVRMTEAMEESKDSTAETDQSKNEKMEVSSITNDGDRVPEGQMEVVHEEEIVKESSTHQEIPGNEASMDKEVSQSVQADKTAVTDIHLAEVVKDAEIEEECKAQEDVAAAPVEEHQLEPVTEMAHGPGGQKAEETAAVLKLQESSVVLVDFNKAPPKQTAASGTSKETPLPHEEVSQEPDQPASTSRSVEERTSNKDMLNQTEAWVVPADKEQADEEEEVEIAENENVGMDDGELNISKATSEGKDRNDDEKMETEDGVVKEDEYVVQGKEPEKVMSTVQGIQGDEEKETTDIQKARTVGEEEKSDTQKSGTQIELAEVENPRKRGKARSTGKQTERSAVGTPVRHSRQLTDLPATSELTTRVLRSSTKQVQTTPSQQNTQPTKVMVQKEKGDQAVNKAEEDKEKTRELPTEVAKEHKTEIVSVTTKGTTVLPDIELREEDSHPGDVEVEVDIRTELFPEQGKFTTEDVLLKEATEAIVDEEKLSDLHETDIVKDVEIEVEGRASVQSIAETAKEQGEATATEIAQEEDEQNADKSLSVFTLQKTAVVLVDFNKVPPKQTIGIESPEETILVRNIDEYREQSNEDEEWRQDKSLVESAEKEQASGIGTSTEATQLQEQDVLNKADGLEEQQILVEVGVEKAITQDLEKPVAEVGEDAMLKTDSEQEKGMFTEETLKDDKVGEVTFEEESTATEADKMVAVCTRKSEGNQSEDLESLTPDHREIVQESSPEEETPVITSRNLRRRIVTVSSSPQRKYKRLPKPEVQANVDTLLVCVPMEVKMPEQKAEHSNEVGNETLEMERQECILGEHEMQVLFVEENSETELEMLQKIAEKGDAAVEESDDKENGAVASDRSVTVEVESTPTEEQKVSVVKMSEVECENSNESKDVGLILHVEGNTAQGKEVGIRSGKSLANAVEEATSQTEEGVERDSAQNTGYHSTKPAYEESSDEEEPIITKNLRQRTITVESPMRRKSKRLCREVVETRIKKAQSGKKTLLVEASSQRETTESIEETSTAVEIKITEPDSKDKSEDAQMACEVMSKEVTALDQQDGKNIAVIVLETMETKTDGGKDMVEGAPEEKLEERTTVSGVHDKMEVKDLIDNSLQEKDPDATSEQDSVQQENFVLDKAEELLLEEKSEGDSRVVEEEKQLIEKEDTGNISTTEEMLDAVEEGVEVERRLLRKRTITIKAATERKSKRMCKQDVEEHAESPLSEEEPVTEQKILKSTAEKETTGQKDPETVDDHDKDGDILSEQAQDHENLEGEETCGETNTSTEAQEVGKETAQFINTSVKELRAKTETQKGEKSEEKDEDTVADMVEKIKDQDQEVKEQNENNPKEYSEISLTPYESFTLELDEEDENNGPKETNVVEEIEVSLMESPHLASTTIQKTDICEEHITEVPAGRSSATASPEQISARRSKRFLQENEMEGKSETKAVKEVIEEQEEKHQQKRKAIADTPRRSKRLATPKTKTNIIY